MLRKWGAILKGRAYSLKINTKKSAMGAKYLKSESDFPTIRKVIAKKQYFARVLGSR